jgi:hypothetical protein
LRDIIKGHPLRRQEEKPVAMFVQHILVGLIFFLNIGALLVGTLLSFLLTSWRARLTWIDWTIALILNLPAASVLMKHLSEAPYDCSGSCYLVMFGGAGFGVGLPLGLLCSKWVIAGSPDRFRSNVR